MKIAKKLTALFLILGLLFAGCNFVFTQYYNSQTLYGSFTSKMERVENINGNKVIMIGGSATNLGLDSATFEQLTGTPVANLAVSAAVPLRCYMKLAEDAAVTGDTIIMSLEYDYYESKFQTVDETYVDLVGLDNQFKCKDTVWGNINFAYTSFLRSFSKANDCVSFVLRSKMKTDSIYIADSTNAYGDFCLHEGKEATYTRAMEHRTFSPNEDTLLQIAEFIRRMDEKGVRVYLTFPPMDGYMYHEHEQFFSDVQKTVSAYIPADRVIGTPFDFLYDASYFYDTAYHLRYECRAEYTTSLCEKYFAIQ